mmetsp:Transcript_22501/g.40540  ORF Transcript_22501/g.40540 Transcript_22501/m.40540 type:complete len:316 (-) Transcript_22501:18-965(-)
MTDTVQSLLELIRMLQTEVNNLTNETKKLAAVEKVPEEEPQTVDNSHIIYSFCENSSDLLMKDIRTLEKKAHTFKEFKFTDGCQYTKLDSGKILLTGGFPSKKDVVEIGHNFKMTPKESMISGRRRHGLTHFNGKVYALSGWEASTKCERYDAKLNFWEELPDIPKATGCVTPVVLEDTESIYVLGGYAGAFLNDIQVFSIPEHTWSVLDIKLPSVGWYMPCFTIGRKELFFIVKRQLWKMSENNITHIKDVEEEIQCCGGPCIFNEETLHCSFNQRHSPHLTIGHLGWTTKRNCLRLIDGKLRGPLYREVLRYL